MSNIVDFLEAVGQNAALRYASNGEMQRMLADAKLDADVRDAVLAKDQQRLTALVGVENVCCLLVPAQVPSFLAAWTDEADEVLLRTACLVGTASLAHGVSEPVPQDAD